MAVPQRPGLRLRTLADVFAEAEAEAEAENVTLCTGGTETQVRPTEGRTPRTGRAFVSGKRQQMARAA